MSLKLYQSEKLYEGMFLFDSNLASRDWPSLERHVQDLLTKNQGEVVYSERWPDRKLCYEIKGAKKGTYYLVYFRCPPDSIRGLKRDAALSERILRILVLYDPELEVDCQKRINREIIGSPEEIEEQRERSRRGIRPLPSEEESDTEGVKSEGDSGLDIGEDESEEEEDGEVDGDDRSNDGEN